MIMPPPPIEHQCWPIINSKAGKQINCHVNTTTNTKSKAEHWKTSSSLSLLSIQRHGVSYLPEHLPSTPTHTHPHTHTRIDNVAASQSQQGSQVKIEKAARYANGKCYLVDALLYIQHGNAMLTDPAPPNAIETKGICVAYMHIYVYIYISIWISWNVIAVQNQLGNCSKMQCRDWLAYVAFLSFISAWYILVYAYISFCLTDLFSLGFN